MLKILNYGTKVLKIHSVSVTKFEFLNFVPRYAQIMLYLYPNEGIMPRHNIFAIINAQNYAEHLTTITITGIIKIVEFGTMSADHYLN